MIFFVVIASKRSAIQMLDFEFHDSNADLLNGGTVGRWEGGRLVVQVWIDLHLHNLQQFIIIRQTSTRQHTARPRFWHTQTHPSIYTQ